MKPVFPLTIASPDGEHESVSDEKELVQALEWFDSESGDQSLMITDAEGRPVVVKIEALDLKLLKLREP